MPPRRKDTDVPPRSPCRVLIADDVPDLRNLLQLLLELEGDFEVVGQARDGAEAVRLAVETAPDLVVLDLSMPVMDGLQALRELRRRAPTSKVVIFSGFDNSSLDPSVLAGGADGYLEKSAAASEVVTRLREICCGDSSA